MSLNPLTSTILDLPWINPRFPWYWRYCGAIFIGAVSIWAGLGSAPMIGRNGEPYSNQRFFHGCFLVLGIAMVGLSLWGLWLRTP